MSQEKRTDMKSLIKTTVFALAAETVPGKGWSVVLRLYGPLKPWIKKTWRPSEIELVK
jgi:hypothetical protein